MEMTYLKLYRKGYENLRMDDALPPEVATEKSVMHVIRDGITTDIHVVFVRRDEYADFEYYRRDGMIERFKLREGELEELDDFNMRAEKIGFNDVCIGFYASRDVVFKRADAKEWNG